MSRGHEGPLLARLIQRKLVAKTSRRRATPEPHLVDVEVLLGLFSPDRPLGTEIQQIVAWFAPSVFLMLSEEFDGIGAIFCETYAPPNDGELISP